MSHPIISLLRLVLVISLSLPLGLFSPTPPPPAQAVEVAKVLLDPAQSPNVETPQTAAPLMEGYAIASLNPGVCNGNDFNSNGNSESVIEGGGIFVNANCAPGLVFNGQGKLATSNVGVYPPDGAFPITIVGTTNGTNCAPPPTPPYSPSGCNLYASPVTIHAAPVDPDPMASTPVQPAAVEAVCNAIGNGTLINNGGTYTATPGNHATLNVGLNNLVLQPGMY